MNADLEEVIESGRRRMRQFEERTSSQIDSFDSEVDLRHYQLGHKFSSITEDLTPVSAPLWGVILETSTGQRVYKQDAPFDVVLKCPRRCPQIRGRIDYEYLQQTKPQSTSNTNDNALGERSFVNADLPVSLSASTIPRLPNISDICNAGKLPYDNYWNLHSEIEPFQPSAAARTIIEGRKWRVDKYLHDEIYVSHPPYGVIMNKRFFEPVVERPKRRRRFEH